MSKKQAAAFQPPVEDLPPAEVATLAAPATEPEASSLPDYRKDRKMLSAWINEKAFRSFKGMVAEEGKTLQEYIVDMVNRELAAKGRYPIAK